MGADDVPGTTLRDILATARVLPVNKATKRPHYPKLGIKSAKPRDAWNGEWPKDAGTGVVCGHWRDDLHLVDYDADTPEAEQLFATLGLPPTCRNRSTRGTHTTLLARSPTKSEALKGVGDRIAEGHYLFVRDEWDIDQPLAVVDVAPSIRQRPTNGQRSANGKAHCPLTAPPVPRGARSELEWRAITFLLQSALPDEELAHLLMAAPGAGERARERGAEWTIAQFERARQQIVELFDSRFAIICSDPVVVADKADPTRRNWCVSQWPKTLPTAHRALGDGWFGSNWVRRYTGLQCHPGPNGERGDCPGGEFNTWTGYTCKPSLDGDWGLLKDHVREIMCAGDDGAFGHLYGWWAHMFQRPFEKPGSAIVVHGETRGGKDIVFALIAEILGEAHATMFDNLDAIVGAQFNASREGKVLVRLEETTFAGSEKEAQRLKSIITATDFWCNAKHRQERLAPCFERFAFTSNNASPLFIEDKDERYTVLAAKPHANAGNPAYFEPIVEQWHNGGKERFLADMLAYDLSGFNPRKAYRTEAKAVVIAACKSPLHDWLETNLADLGQPLDQCAVNLAPVPWVSPGMIHERLVNQSLGAPWLVTGLPAKTVKSEIIKAMLALGYPYLNVPHDHRSGARGSRGFYLGLREDA
jgi:Family of unknown function (DUF5906)/Bifunctional DNA primase/polymerase, N-terminal